MTIGLLTDMAYTHDQPLGSRQCPLYKGQKFLLENARKIHSTTDRGDMIRECFSQLLILEATGDWNLVGLELQRRTWNYFIGEQHLIPGIYPDDTDTTSLALFLLPGQDKVAHSVMDEMLTLVSPEGIIMTYFDQKRPRIDPTVCVNILRLFYRYGRNTEPKLQPTKRWVCETLFQKTYLDGTRYYASPDVFLFYFSHLLQENPNSDIYSENISALKAQLIERMHHEGDALEVAMRINAGQSLGVHNRCLMLRLLAMQCPDGGWNIGWLCRTGKNGIRIGNRALVTALAVKAIQKEQGVQNHRVIKLRENDELREIDELRESDEFGR